MMQQPGAAPLAPPPKKGLSTGCIVGIVILAIGVVMVPIMAVLGIYGVRKYLASAKSAEARNSVGAIARASVASFERDRRLCGSAQPVPSDLAEVAAKKYAPSSAEGHDYETGSEKVGWRCLKFVMSQPQYYQYHYVSGGPWVTSNGATAGAKGFEAAARGDLNGDGVASSFSRTGKIVGDQVALEDHLFIENEFE